MLPKDPALQLNEVASANAQKANYDAAGAVSQTGPLQADPNLPSGFQKDATGRIFQIGQGSSPVVTSTDGKAEFDKNKSEADIRLKAIADRTAASDAAKTDAAAKGDAAVVTDPKFNEENGRVENTQSDPVADSLNKWETDRKAEFDLEAEKRKEGYDSLFTTSLASIDAATAATIDNIKQSYTKRIDEQRRINDLNIARVKAYGLANGGQYTPIDFSDAVSNREEEAANKISALEGERNALLAQAKAAAESGKTALLRTHMEDLAKIEDDLRANLEKVHTEANAQYEVLQTLRKQAEQEHKDKLAEARTRFAAVASTFLDQYDGKDQAGKDALIKQIMAETGLDYAAVFSEMQKASSDAALLATKTAKENRKETKEFDGNLYTVTYDDDGNPVMTLLKQKAPKAGSGSGGGSGSVKLTPTDIKKMTAQGLDPNNAADKAAYIAKEYGDEPEEEDEKMLSLAEFERVAMEQVGGDGQPLYNQSNASLKSKYDEYVKAYQGQRNKKILTATDKKKMIAQDLDPEDEDDIAKYYKAEFDPLAQ